MTRERKKWDRWELRLRLFSRWGYACSICGRPLAADSASAQLAHRIANTKANRKRYGVLVIDHEANLRPVCSLTCNDKANIGGRPVEAALLAAQIRGIIAQAAQSPSGAT